MATATLASTGTMGGTCASCSHLECIAARQIAAEPCRLCRRPIGFVPFYSEPDAKVHADCLENELAKKLKAGLPQTQVKFLTVEETAELLRVEPETIRNWVSQNRIPFRKAGAKTLFLLEEILEWTMPANKRPRRTRLLATR
ncbi:MAG: hypothetical protein DMF61_23950 [Blastocatellia bacterium AA13]|nr:MAG: hypothetical protein DMF61_23950 [Blastocatellia bacterium AA13]